MDIDKHLFNSLHRLIALIEPGAGSNFERPLLAQSGRPVGRRVAQEPGAGAFSRESG
jgi:hypothetical protein